MEITLYHGSEKIIEKPLFGFPNAGNDFGSGFYCTENPDLAREWAVDDGRDGYINKYTLDTEELRVLDLGSEEYSVLHWLTLLVTYRKEEGDGKKKRSSGIDRKPDSDPDIEWLKANFRLQTEAYDIIKGYRADDNYFSVIESILGGLPVQFIMQAQKLCGWGSQIVLKSEKAFSRINFMGCSAVACREFYSKRQSRDLEVIKKYAREISKNHQTGNVTLGQLECGAVSKDDPRLWGR